MKQLVGYTKCDKCGKEAKVDTGKVLLSYPPKNQYYCECGYSGYCFSDDVKYVYIDSKN